MRVDQARRQAALLAWFTIAYNTAEGVVAIGAGLAAGSVALISFGLDSGIEVLSALAICWQFSRQGERAEERERRTMQMIAVAFWALAVYVTVESLRSLISREHPEVSALGIGLAIASVIVMPVLAVAKRRTARALGSATVLADSAQTMLCTYLSFVLLVGLVLNAALGWAWADPLAGLFIAGLAVKEARKAWNGESCCAPPNAIRPTPQPTCASTCCETSAAD